MKKNKHKIFLFLMVCMVSIVATASVFSVFTKNTFTADNKEQTNVSNVDKATEKREEKKDVEKTESESADIIIIETAGIFEGVKEENKEFLNTAYILNGTIKKDAFLGCENLKKLYINVNVILEEGAFNGVELEYIIFTGVGALTQEMFDSLNIDLSIIKNITIFKNEVTDVGENKVEFDEKVFDGVYEPICNNDILAQYAPQD